MIDFHHGWWWGGQAILIDVAYTPVQGAAMWINASGCITVVILLLNAGQKPKLHYIAILEHSR